MTASFLGGAVQPVSAPRQGMKVAKAAQVVEGEMASVEFKDVAKAEERAWSLLPPLLPSQPLPDLRWPTMSQNLERPKPRRSMQLSVLRCQLLRSATSEAEKLLSSLSHIFLVESNADCCEMIS